MAKDEILEMLDRLDRLRKEAIGAEGIDATLRMHPDGTAEIRSEAQIRYAAACLNAQPRISEGFRAALAVVKSDCRCWNCDTDQGEAKECEKDPDLDTLDRLRAELREEGT